MLSFLEKIVTNQDEIVLIEGKLHDYETINELTDILLDVWSFFSVKLTERLDSTPQASEISLQEYKKLEESLQKHEGQIRNHIAVEQQLRLCAETFQNKVEELEKEKEKESFLNKEATETLKTQLYESQTVVNNMKKTIEIYQKTISKQEKSLEEMKKKMFQGSISDERKVLGLSYQNREEDGLSPTLRNKNMKKNNDGLGNLHDYLRIRNVKKIKSISQHKFEETPIPAKALFSIFLYFYK